MNYDTRTVQPPGLGLEFDVLREDTIIGPAIEKGAWEDHETTLFLTHIEPGCTVLDLGANVGWFSVQAIRAGATVHAFEPVPGIADVAERNIERANKLGPGKGRLHRFAAGDAPGSALIALAATNRGDNRVTDGDLPDDMQDAETVEIQIARVDDFVDSPVRVMKIDTQGSEWLALLGAKQTLARSPELALLLEFWPYALRGAKPEQLLEFLELEGFQLGKATAAPYPMNSDRILKQALARDPVKGGLDLYGTRGLPFHVQGPKARLRSMWRALRED